MLTVNFLKTDNYSAEQVIKLNRAKALMEQVLNSDAFHDKVINYHTGGKLTFSFKKDLFRHFERYTNEEVYAMIMQASEETGNVADGSIDLYLVLEPGNDGDNLGYGLPGRAEIHTYADFFNSTTDARLANHLTHEWCHKIGFSHAFLAWMDAHREDSVPYAIGNLVEELASN